MGDAGLSVPTKPFTGADDVTLWLDEVLSALNLTALHLVGHSFGGGNGANFAVRFPHKLLSLTLLEPTFALVFPPLSVLFYATVASLTF